MRDGGMVRGAPSGVKGACPAHVGCGMVGARKPWCRRSSGVEHALGKGGVVSSILTGGTTKFLEIIAIGDSSDRAGLGNVRGTRGGKWEKSAGRGKRGERARNARGKMGEIGEGGKGGGMCAERAGENGRNRGEGGNRGKQGERARNARELGDGEVGREES